MTTSIRSEAKIYKVCNPYNKLIGSLYVWLYRRISLSTEPIWFFFTVQLLISPGMVSPIFGRVSQSTQGPIEASRGEAASSKYIRCEKKKNNFIVNLMIPGALLDIDYFLLKGICKKKHSKIKRFKLGFKHTQPYTKNIVYCRIRWLGSLCFKPNNINTILE